MILKEGIVMYGGKGGGGAVSLVGGSVVLPFTGGHLILTIVAISGVTVGSAILLSIFGRWVAKRIYTRV
jgi:hypothetical protein